MPRITALIGLLPGVSHPLLLAAIRRRNLANHAKAECAGSVLADRIVSVSAPASGSRAEPAAAAGDAGPGIVGQRIDSEAVAAIAVHIGIRAPLAHIAVHV